MDEKLDQEELVVFTDGGARGNPGPAGIGVVITTPDEQILEAFGRYIGATTNNQAEYRAVIAAFEVIKAYSPRKIRFNLDSKLVVEQLSGRYKVKNAELKPLHTQILGLMQAYGSVEFTHVYREANKLADEQVNIAIDQALGLKN